MRFLVFMIPGVYQPKHGKNTDARFTPNAEMVAKMGRFNEELKKAGALLSLDGLQPLTTGARVAFSNGAPTVTDASSVEAKEVVGGYMILSASDLEEAVRIARQCPGLVRPGSGVEVIEIHAPPG